MAAVLQNIYKCELQAWEYDSIEILERGLVMIVEYDPGIWGETEDP